MSAKVKEILARLKEELGGVVQVKNFIEKELAALVDEAEEVLGLKPEDNTLAPPQQLSGHGAGEPPAGTPVVPMQPPVDNDHVAEGATPFTAADVEANATGNDSTTQESVSTPAQPSETAETPAPVVSDPASTSTASDVTGEVVGDGDTAQTVTSAPSEAPSADAPEDVKAAE